MGFGFNLDAKIEVPKVDLPKVEVPKIDVESAVNSAASAVTNAVSSVTETVSKTVESIAKSLPSLDTVAGAIAEVAVSFTGAIEDFTLEPHMSLEANASYENTKFEKGPVVIIVELTIEEARANNDIIHLFSSSGNYNEEKNVKEFKAKDCHSIAVLFKDLPMNETYSLEVISDNAKPHLIFSGVTYGDLRSYKQNA